jgi:hypothetical protein
MDLRDMKKYFDYLNDLRESGVTNMWGAGEYLVEEFGIDAAEAKDILVEWIKTFIDPVVRGDDDE